MVLEGYNLAKTASMKISAVIPVFNHAQYVAFAIDCALRQIRPCDEVIVIDDGSTDGSAEIVKSYGSRVRYVYQRNSGVGAARNLGMRIAGGEWVAFLDADDGWMPEKLQRQAEAAAGQAEAVLVHTGIERLQSDGTLSPGREVVPASRHWPMIRYMNPIAMSSAMVSREAALAVGGFNERLTSCEDWDLWYRLRRRGSFVTASERLTIIRILDDSMSTNIDRMLANMEAIREGTLLEGVTEAAKPLWTRRIRAAANYHAAVTARCISPTAEWKYLIRSFVQWPFPNFLPSRTRALLRASFGGRSLTKLRSNSVSQRFRSKDGAGAHN